MKRCGESAGGGKVSRLSAVWGVLLLIAATVLSGCAGIGATGGAASTGVPSVGPQLSSDFGTDANDANDGATTAGGLPKIDVVVSVFDPNLPEDSDTWEKKGVYAELRRAESNRFALKMKAALEDTNAFGAVRVVPNAMATGDLYVLGKILQSNGEDVKIGVSVTDISGRQWFDKNFSHRVKERFHSDIRNKGKDAYDPVFEKAAEAIVKRLKKRTPGDLQELQLLSELRFGGSLSEETFSKYLNINNGRVKVAAAPADDDPMLLRIKPIRVRDQLFIDRMQTHYGAFDDKLNDSYLVWQEQSMAEVKAARVAKRKAIAQGILGGLLVVAGAVASAEADNSIEEVAGAGAVIGGAVALSKSFQNRAEMKVHREALAELGQSIDIEIAPQVVEYEEQTAKLTGDAAQQYAQWIAFLKKIYDAEATPDKEL